MTDGILANHAGIHGHAQDVVGVAKTLESSHQNLQHEIKNQTQSWSGDAQAAYLVLQAKWDQNAADLQNVLKQIAKLMGSAADSYSATDKKMAQNFGG